MIRAGITCWPERRATIWRWPTFGVAFGCERNQKVGTPD